MAQIWQNGAWIDAESPKANNVFVSSTAPSNPIIGTLWFDTTINKLKIWNGSNWLLTA